MICLYRRPDKILVRVVSDGGKEVSGAKSYRSNDLLWGKRAGDLAEGVYDNDGKFVGSFTEYWADKPPPTPVYERTGWWSKRLLK